MQFCKQQWMFSGDEAAEVWDLACLVTCSSSGLQVAASAYHLTALSPPLRAVTATVGVVSALDCSRRSSIFAATAVAAQSVQQHGMVISPHRISLCRNLAHCICSCIVSSTQRNPIGHTTRRLSSSLWNLSGARTYN